MIKFMIIDDDEAVRSMLQDIIEDYSLGEVAVSLPSAVTLDNTLLTMNGIGVLIIDMLMPDIDGVRSVQKIRQNFRGKVIMLSQVVKKDLVGKAYEQGVDFYITKPLNRNEVVNVIRRVCDYLRLESFAKNVQSSLTNALAPQNPAPNHAAQRPLGIMQKGMTILRELGIASGNGSTDLLDILEWIDNRHFTVIPPQKEIFQSVAAERGAADPVREGKAMEQRIRRTIFQGTMNIATMGIVDYTNPKFEEYAPLYFDYDEVRRVMNKLEHNDKPRMSDVHINTKKFIHALYRTSNATEPRHSY